MSRWLAEVLAVAGKDLRAEFRTRVALSSLGLFALTGVLANIGSWAAGLYGVGIGASGGIMGLIGLALGFILR